MGVLSKALSFFRGRDRGLDAARTAEARGDLEQAIASYLQAGAKDDAARLQLVRADAAATPQARYQLLGQALALAQGPTRQPIVARRAELALELFRQGSLVLTRPELLDLATDVERCGASILAADLYELAGDQESRTRALVEAGAVDRLEQVLSEEAAHERSEREQQVEVRKIADLDACGRRREALALARATQPGDERARTLAKRIAARKTEPGMLRLLLDGALTEVAFASPATIGRADATVVIPSPSLSRQHLVLRNSDRGPEVADLGSRNGTTLRGVRLDVPVLVGTNLSLVLGGQVDLGFTSHASGGVCVEFGSRRVLLPLGPLQLEHLTLSHADDGWLELSANGAAYLNGLRIDARAQLGLGDRVSASPEGDAILEVRS